ncbi:hypothetical protein [Thermosynechococcus sp. FA-CM-4201]
MKHLRWWFVTLVSLFTFLSELAIAAPTKLNPDQLSPSCSPSLSESCITGLDDLSGLTAAVLDFSEEESDLAVALFGCDCPQHIAWVRQMKQSWLE